MRLSHPFAAQVLVRRDDKERASDRVLDSDSGGAPGVSGAHKHKFPWELEGAAREHAPPKARAMTLTSDHRATAPGEGGSQIPPQG